MREKIIMTAEDIRRTLIRIAHEIIERSPALDQVVLVGMHTRGVPLARRLANIIKNFEQLTLPVGTLDISLYRDDLALLEVPPVIRHTDLPANLNEKSVILVDDVLYTGRSIRAAMDALIDHGRPRLIQLAVLIDRGHREMPIRPDYVGKNVPSSRFEEIQVRLTETDGVDEVVIISAPNHEPARSEARGGASAGRLQRSDHDSSR